jgi:hypothetical protein
MNIKQVVGAIAALLTGGGGLTIVANVTVPVTSGGHSTVTNNTNNDQTENKNEDRSKTASKNEADLGTITVHNYENK